MLKNINNINYIRQRVLHLFQTAALLLGMVSLLSLLGWIFAGVNGLVWAFFISIGILLISPNLPPSLILRLYSAKPLSSRGSPRLYEMLAALVRRAELPSHPTLYYLPTRAVNAFAIGNRNNAAIAVTDGMLNTLNLRELTSVLAHEVSHLKNNDLWILNLSNTISRVTSFFSMAGQFLLVLNLPLVLFSERHISWIAILVLIFAPTITMLLQLALSRTREFNADLSAAMLTGDPEGLASALWKIERHQSGWLPRTLFPGRRQAQSSALRTHPNTGERVKRLLALADNRQTTKPQMLGMPGMDFSYRSPVMIPIRHSFKKRYGGTPLMR